MKTFNLAEAKTNLSRLVQAVRAGTESEIVIALAGVPVAKLVPYGNKPRRVLGTDAGTVKLPGDFGELDAEITALFEGDGR